MTATRANLRGGAPRRYIRSSIHNAVSSALQAHHDIGGSLASSLWLLLAPFLGNVALLMPLGFMAPWLSARYRSWGRVAAVALATTVTIETLQFVGSLAYGFPYKRFDVDDIWLNLLGGLIGYGIYKLVAPMLRGRTKAKGGAQDGAPAACDSEGR